MTTPCLKSRRPQAEHSLLSPVRKTISAAEAGGKERHLYKPLPKQFRHNGFQYRQIAREGEDVIYEQKWTSCPNPSLCFEVIRVKRRKPFEINGRFIGPAEVYPNSEAWGVDGFTFTDKEAAFAKLREVERK